MSEKKETSPALKRSWFQELSAEFKKITWPTRNDVIKQTLLVTFITVVCSALIAGIDYLAKMGVDKLINL